jgi:hypothetical protein
MQLCRRNEALKHKHPISCCQRLDVHIAQQCRYQFASSAVIKH